MKRGVLSLTVCLAMAGFLMSACDKEQPIQTNIALKSDEGISLEKDFGGYTTSDEAPMFGDEVVLAESREDGTVNDPVSQEAATNPAVTETITAYEVRVTWGLLEGDSTAKELLDWSGKVSVSRGVLAVLKVVRFESELQGDRVHLPRTSSTELAFTSYADTHYDGLLLLIVDNDLGNSPGQFTVQTGSYSRTFTFDELALLNVVEPVGPNGHAVSIVSRIRGAKAFAGGFLSGRWVQNDDRSGEFRGRWIDSEGTTAGSVRGIWGERRNGEKLFFGKYIGLNGGFSGLLAGDWRYNGDDDAGVFEGIWFDSDLQKSGVVAGNFKLGRSEDCDGFFNGRWFTQR
ncbi:MAG: hypothetical protein ACREOO_12670 [bacterium]